MFERLILSALALCTGLFVLCASTGARGGTENGPAAAGPADIELRKSFRAISRAGRHTSRSVQHSSAEGDPGAAGEARGIAPPQLGAIAAALGEQLQSSGTLHLPGIGESEIVLQASTTPILETATGRHLIIDRDHTIEPGLVDGISRRWPGFSVVQPPVGANLNDVIGRLLDAAGYDSVLRAAPLTFGSGITIRIDPDFVVLRSERDLLTGETRAISVVDPADALPSELRELAAEHQVLVVELTPDGVPAGSDPAPWRDPSGRVTTIEAARLGLIIEEIAVALGLAVERHVPLPAAAGDPDGSADLRISRDHTTALVFVTARPRYQEPAGSPDTPAIMLNSAADLPVAVGALLKRFGFTAIGPAVEFYRAPASGSPRRFVISVPGWLVESGGRRLLITGATPPPAVRLFLTREDIDIFEYRVAGR